MTVMTVFSSVYAFAQADCAVSVCSEASSHSNIAMILDASLLLASIIIFTHYYSGTSFSHLSNPGTTPGFPFDPLRIRTETPSGSRRFDGAAFLFAFAPVIRLSKRKTFERTQNLFSELYKSSENV